MFREYGPLAGNTVRVGYEYAPSWGGLLSRQTADVDARYYMRLGTNGVLAFRARGFRSWGEFPGYLYFGGNSELRGYDYLQFLGQASSQRRVRIRSRGALRRSRLGGLAAGVLQLAVGYEGLPMKVWSNNSTVENAAPRFVVDPTSPSCGLPSSSGADFSGFASWTAGLVRFGSRRSLWLFPIHFDWSCGRWQRTGMTPVFATGNQGVDGSKMFRQG